MCLKIKQWAQLDVEKLSVVSTDPTAAMKGLHLDGRNNGQEKKDLLLGLLKHHGIGEDKKGDGAGYEVNDPAADKGKGLVILLYGTPGVGKTMTGRQSHVKGRPGKPC